MHCASCGYRPEHHKPETGHCPGPDGGYLKTVRWQQPGPADRLSWREIMHRDWLARQAAYEAAHAPHAPVVVPPPQVPARPPAGPGELAGYQGKQAVGLGRTAVAAGWAVEAAYWRAGDGTEGCAVRMVRDDLYAVATWTRKPGSIGKGSGWSADVAYGVRRGDMPVKLNHTELERIISGK